MIIVGTFYLCCMTHDLRNTDFDIHLFSVILEGNRAAFECLFQKFYTVLCDYSWTYPDEKSEAEDVVQDLLGVKGLQIGVGKRKLLPILLGS